MNNRKFNIVLIFLFLLIFILDNVSANPTVTPAWMEIPLWLLLITFTVGPLLEAVCVNGLLYKNEKFKIRMHVILYLFLLNIITMPITQFFVILIEEMSNRNLFIIAELFPIITEFALLFLFFTVYYKRDKIEKSYSCVRIFLMSLVANILTISFGLLMFFVLT